MADDSHWGGNTSIFCSIRNSVSLWYVGVRNLAAVILIIIAFYVGLRMALATVAEELGENDFAEEIRRSTPGTEGVVYYNPDNLSKTRTNMLTTK